MSVILALNVSVTVSMCLLALVSLLFFEVLLPQFFLPLLLLLLALLSLPQLSHAHTGEPNIKTLACRTLWLMILVKRTYLYKSRLFEVPEVAGMKVFVAHKVLVSHLR